MLVSSYTRPHREPRRHFRAFASLSPPLKLVSLLLLLVHMDFLFVYIKGVLARRVHAGPLF